jgi:hypothetical protein
MKIIINNHRKIFAIQEEFNTLFPGLKILFYAKPSHPGASPSNKLVEHSSKTLQDCRAIHNEGTLNILPTMNISDLKGNFRDIFGLSVEIVKNGDSESEEAAFSDKQTIGEISRQYSM